MKSKQIIGKLKPTYYNDTQESYVEVVKVADYESIPTQVSKRNLLTCKLRKNKSEKYFFVAELERVTPKQTLREYQTKYVTLLVPESEIA